jgi:hypothetical protein
MVGTNGYDPEFELKLTAHAVETFSPKADPGDLHKFFLHHKWKGKMTVIYPGNGGVTAITFEEPPKKLSEEPDSLPYER